jgi:hypothetical protein
MPKTASHSSSWIIFSKRADWDSACCASALASATPKDQPAAAAPVDGLDLAAWGGTPALSSWLQETATSEPAMESANDRHCATPRDHSQYRAVTSREDHLPALRASELSTGCIHLSLCGVFPQERHL